MTGPKLNEKSFVPGQRSGTKATAKYVRSSAYKARVVLDLIRGLPVHQADEVLQFNIFAMNRADEAFEIVLRNFAQSPDPLNASIDSTESLREWDLQRISFDSGDGQREGCCQAAPVGAAPKHG